MEEGEFDDIAKQIGRFRNRRDTLKTLGLGLLGAAGLGAGLEAEAKEKGKKAKGKHAKGKQQAAAKGKQQPAGKGKGKKGHGNAHHHGHAQNRAAVATPTPTFVSGNPTCNDVGESTTGGSTTDQSAGTHTVSLPASGGCGNCTITYTISNDQTQLVSFSSTCFIKKVLVKGSNGALLYDYGSPGTQSGGGLLTPCTGNSSCNPLPPCPGSGCNQSTISHINFCGITCCTPKTCSSQGVGCGSNIDDGCGGTINCPCSTQCPGGGANNTCNTDKGICVCNKNACQGTGQVGDQCGTGFDDGCCGKFDCNCSNGCPGGGANNSCGADGTCACTADTCQTSGNAGDPCGTGFKDGCCGTFDCNCKTTCPNGGKNNTCGAGGKCACTADHCQTAGNVGDPCGTGFDDGCCSTYDCNCSTTCPGGGANNTCGADGKCACMANTCQTSGNVGDPCGSFKDGCCGTYQCNCATACPGGGANNTCGADGKCACTPTSKDVACQGKTCRQTVSDGCCGTYTCGGNSCTIGYYTQNTCRWPNYTNPSCGTNSNLYSKCKSYFITGTTTFNISKAIAARGNDTICAQAAAAYLNSLLPNSCTAGVVDICKSSITDLTSANQFGTCPLAGCGSS